MSEETRFGQIRFFWPAFISGDVLQQGRCYSSCGLKRFLNCMVLYLWNKSHSDVMQNNANN